MATAARPEPGRPPRADRAHARRRIAWAACSALAILLAPAGDAWAGKGYLDAHEGENVVEVKFQGNASIGEEKIRAKIQSRAGRPLDQSTVILDTRKLLETKWFSDVEAVIEPGPDRKGVILIFKVTELPVLREVLFMGRNKIKLKDLEESTGLKKGARADFARAQMAVHQIETLYREKGFEKAEVKLIEGGKPGETRVVFEIFEGPKFSIESIDFIGNSFVDDDVLKTKIETRFRLFGLLGAKRHTEGLDTDKRSLIDYYKGHGFFDVAVSATTKPGADLGKERVTFTISEGIQYKVRSIKFEGNKKVKVEELKSALQMKEGEVFNGAVRDIDQKELFKKYWKLGCIDTRIDHREPTTEQPGMVDIVYRIEEGDEYFLGQFIVRGNARTKDKVVRREAIMAGLLPGEVLDLNRIEIFTRRLSGTGYFITGQGPQQAQGKPIEVKIINRRPGDRPFGEGILAGPGDAETARMQSPDNPPPSEAPQTMPPMSVPTPSSPAPPAGGLGQGGATPFGGPDLFAPPANTVPQLPVTPLPATPAPLPPAIPGRPGRPQGPPPAGTFDPTDPTRQFPSYPQNNANDVGPDRQEPFPNRSYADIVTNVDEAPTGRLQFGVGASSYSGINGSVIFSESNFDLFAIPRSFSELTSGRAFRGAGQQFEINLQPGTLINRYIISFRDPYLFGEPFGFGIQGYQFSRYYPDFSERRSGGRISLGYQFGPQIYADVAARVEDVDIHGFKYPAPPQLLAVAGHTTLFTLRPAIKLDNRNNPIAPSQGQYVEAAFEQGLGTFSFPKFTLEGRQHFTTGSRPDNSGKRVLTFRGFFGVTGRDTPIYERFFAGDFRSMRGFYYRGVGPHDLGVNTGGVLSAIGSVEYQFPLTANDHIQQVIFCDFGTVEGNYTFTTIRAAVGTGLRVVIPAITKQLPLSFDLAFPVSKAEGDRVKYFSFFIGAFW
jgi:outer membrane protein insertion porin family